MRNLSRNNQLETYDDIIREQQKGGIVETVDIREQQKAGIVETVDRNTSCQNKKFYIPHKAVIRESAQAEKVQIVYDASAKANSNSASLSDCLEVSPSLQKFAVGYSCKIEITFSITLWRY